MEEALIGKLKTKKLALFFTYGVSLGLWREKGMLERELKMYKELGKHFGQIYFLTYGQDDEQLADELLKFNIKVLAKKRNWPNFIYSLIMPFIYKSELSDCDFYKTNQMLGSWSAVIAKWLFKKKLIVRTGYCLSEFARRSSNIKFLFAKMIECLALRSCNLFVVATLEENKYFSKFKQKTVVIPNHVDTDVFYPLPELKNKESKKILLFIGRLSKQKNLEGLIQAMSGLSDLCLQIIGSGELRNHLQMLAEKNKVEVEFLGNRPHSDLPKYINHADIFVLPSLYEGNPKVLLEAMACGAPILATKVPGIESVLEHKKQAYLTSTSSKDIHDSIKEMLANSGLMLFLGKSARETAEQNFSFLRVREKELDNYT